MTSSTLCLRRLAKVLAGVAIVAAVAVPAAAAHPEVPVQVLDAFHPLGMPVDQPWLDGVQLESSGGAAFSRARATGVIVGNADTKVECTGNGTGGKRVQLMYVRDVDQPDNYAADKAQIGQWAVNADRIYRESAAKTQGAQRIRFVHDASCNVSILDVVVDDPNDLSAAVSGKPLADAANLIKAQGFTDPDRKYVMFVDNATALCGGAWTPQDSSPGQGNLANGSPNGTSGYARIDFTMTNCNNTPDSIMAHELGHDLGAVQLDAPHSNGQGHCWDDADRLCQDDGTGLLTTVCNGPNDEQLLDCNNDDYFNAHPAAGTYLAMHWNLANSDFLASNPASQWGFVKAEQPTAASYTPADDYNRNSTNQQNTIARTATGVYQVTFTDLANFGGQSGTALATALGSAGEHCTVSAWSSNGTPDTTVTVRCYSAAGAPADTQFDAAYIRPTSSPRPFAYLWANDEMNPSYTPSTFHQFNSSGGVNTITRSGVGNYTVTLAGLASDGGTVKVTAFNAAANWCKIEWWAPSGANEQVEVRCFDTAGAPVDSKFTLVFADGQSILSNGNASGYVASTNPTPAGTYTPPAATNYNSTGPLNTVTRNSTGSYTVTMPGLGSQTPGILPTDRGTVHVTATTAAAKRCEVTSYTSPIGVPPANPIPLNVAVTCTTAAGALTDSKFVLQFTR
jgi:hypothetical protein